MIFVVYFFQILGALLSTVIVFFKPPLLKDDMEPNKALLEVLLLVDIGGGIGGIGGTGAFVVGGAGGGTGGGAGGLFSGSILVDGMSILSFITDA